MNKLLVSVFLLLGVTFVFSLPSVTLEFTEPISVPSGWTQSFKPNPTNLLNLNIAVKLQNGDILSETLEQVSNPLSPKYGQYLSHEEVGALVMPKAESVKSVIEWLQQNGIFEHENSDGEFFKVNPHKEFIKVKCTVAKAAKMFSTEFNSFFHKQSRKMIVKSLGPYSVPQDIAEHIDFVSGIVGFPLSQSPLVFTDFKLDDTPITPAILRNRYNVTKGYLGQHRNSSQAVAEFQGQYFTPADLTTFFKKFVPFAVPGDNAKFKVVGDNSPSTPGTEAELDIQYIMGVAPNISTAFYINADDDFWSGITDWQSLLSSTREIPWVHSISYGSQDAWPSDSYIQRSDQEFQKLGVRGVSIIFASGDYGTGCELCLRFKPSYPASSPYVTSVGATQFLDGPGVEIAVSAFGSGGGFSPKSYQAQPSYQSSAVSAYFKNAPKLPDPIYYSKNGRATPDVSALGWGFQVIQGGIIESVGGTSASAPTFSGIIAMLNDMRFEKGSPSLGFLNPWIYNSFAT
eukprot:TRINITY_DN5544_c0_g1_i5.p1 TRINITY_DN5544_c0_g1~~TRINITY_DN5544_c0_g1_i5.p1  ORF type:complete len:557 (+),score=131.73 TRINITY_DN5544_c0_g1_i5:128-1672(+)